MKLTFAGIRPLSSGSKKTAEEREKVIQGYISQTFSPSPDRLSKDKALTTVKALLVMRWQLASSGYGWRMYEINNIELLLEAFTAEDYADAKANGYKVSVVSMGTKTEGGRVYSCPVECPYLRYLRIIAVAKKGVKEGVEQAKEAVEGPKEGWKDFLQDFLEKLSVRALVY